MIFELRGFMLWESPPPFSVLNFCEFTKVFSPFPNKLSAKALAI